jgi:hypothetical protein
MTSTRKTTEADVAYIGEGETLRDPKTVTVGEIFCHAPVLSHAATARWGVARPDPAGCGTGLRIGELPDAVRAAADAASRLSATATGPRIPAWRPPRRRGITQKITVTGRGGRSARQSVEPAGRPPAHMAT